MTASLATSLRDSRTELLDAILGLAVAHHDRCRRLEAAAYRYYGINGGPHDAAPDDAPLNDLQSAVVEVCAAIAGPALRRVDELDTVAALLVDRLGEMRGDELERFLRPLFVEAGIGEDYVS